MLLSDIFCRRDSPVVVGPLDHAAFWWVLLALFVLTESFTVGGVGIDPSETQKPELILQTGHTSSVTRVIFGPSEKWIATASSDSSIKLWEPESGREIRSLTGHSGSVRALGRSYDGKYIASGGNDRTVRIWEVSSGKQVSIFETGNSPVQALAFSTDGARLAAVGTDGFIKIWDVASGQFKDHSVDSVAFTAVVFSPAGDMIAVGSSDGSVRLWNPLETRKPRLYKAEEGAIGSLAFNANGTVFAAAGANKKISIWRADKAKKVTVFAKHEASVLAVAFISDNEIASVGSDQAVHFWDPTTGLEKKQGAVSRGGYAEAISAAIRADGKVVLVGRGDRTAKLIDSESGDHRQTFETSTVGCTSVAFSPDRRWLVAGSYDNTVKIWDLRSGEGLRPLSGHDGFVRSVVFHPDNQRVISGSIDGKILIWNIVRGGEPIELNEEHKGGVNSVAISAAGNVLVSGGVEGVVRLWDLSTLREIKRFQGHSGDVQAVAINPDGTFVISGGEDKTTRLWNISDGSQLRLPDHNGAVRAVAISPDGRTVASGGLDGAVKLWDVTTKLPKSELSTSGPGILSLSYSPDGQWLSAGTSEKAVKVWRLGDRDARQITEAHNGAINSIAYSPDGKWLATASVDGAIGVWQEASLTKKATLASIGGGNDWLVVSPEGYFDGSPDSWRQILWRFSGNTMDVSPVEVFFNEFYQPGLLTDLVEGRGLPDRLDISQKDRRQPVIYISADTKPNAAMVRIKLRVKESNVDSGARDVRLFRNGSLVRSWNYDVLENSRREVLLEDDLPIVYGKNEFTAYAFNRDNVKSADVGLTVTGPENLRRDGVTHVIAIGVGKYQDPARNLSYIESDVNEFVDTFEQKQNELGQKKKIRITKLLDEKATKAAIIGTLRNLAGATSESSPVIIGTDQKHTIVHPEDSVVVYFSGHGFSSGKRFYIVPHDIGTSSEGFAQIAGNSISDLELRDVFERLDARDILLIVDACNSGKALESEEKRMGPMNHKGFAQLAYEKGMFVLTASQPDEAAFVSAERKRSYLTFALVEEGLKLSKADTSPTDGRIYLREWFDYASRRVPEMRNEDIEKAKKNDAEKGLREAPARPGLQRPRVFYRRHRNREEMVIALSQNPRSDP